MPEAGPLLRRCGAVECLEPDIFRPYRLCQSEQGFRMGRVYRLRIAPSGPKSTAPFQFGRERRDLVSSFRTNCGCFSIVASVYEISTCMFMWHLDVKPRNRRLEIQRSRLEFTCPVYRLFFQVRSKSDKERRVNVTSPARKCHIST